MGPSILKVFFHDPESERVEDPESERVEDPESERVEDPREGMEGR